jgi:hypothetical protein
VIKTGLFSARSHRGGYTLVFFAMLMFALMGLAALVIDIGFARLTQRQMQTAVDSAALEGLRFRDGIPEEWLNDPVMKAEIEAACGSHPALPQNPGDPDWQIWLNCVRRWAASRNVAFVFDDDLDPSDDDGAFYDDNNPDPNVGQQFNVAGQFGAGPVLEFTDGAGSDPDLAASEFINDPTNPNSNPRIGSYPATPVYKPTRGDGTPGLELNLDNTIYGDMVAGSFDATTQNVDFNPPEGDTNLAINEYSNPPVGDNYVQRNFRPSAPATANAFLVRMRRSNNLDGLDEQQDVSTHGPTVPYLFGRGSFLAVRDPEMVSDYLPRRHGMTVRATGIADSRSVLSVGMPDESATPPLKGLARFSLLLSDWNSLTVGAGVLRDLSNVGVISVSGMTTGRFFDVGPTSSMPVVVGRTLPDSSAPSEGEYTGYVAIYDEIASGGTTVNRIVGFGLATATVLATGAEVEITRHDSAVAEENASAVVCHPQSLTNEEWQSVHASNDAVNGPLFAPVSVR